MITIYKSDETDFTHRGLGRLPDATEAEVQEIINGIFDLRVTYPKDGRKADLLQEERFIKASTPKGDQTFRIYKIRKDLPYIEAHALHRFYDLSDNFIEDTFVQNKGGQAALQQLLDMSILPHDFTCTSDVPGPLNLRVVRYNTVAAIMGDEEENTLLKRGGGEIERDNNIIRWKQRLGEDRGVKIKYRKNLLGLDFESDYSPVVTRIMPQGFDGLFLPEKYVDSPRINDYHMPKIQKREYPVISAEKNPDEEGAIPHDEALAKLRTLAAEEFSNGLDLPTISCFVDFIDLAQTAEYKEYQVLERTYIGDTIHVIYPEQNIELSARMTMYTWDALKHRYNTMFVGTMKNELQSSITAGERALVKAEEVQQSMMEKAREVATILINSGFGGHVRYYPDRILIMDTEEEATAEKVWQWNINGLGYSSTGINGPYETAMVDGQIHGERITAGSITANKLAADVGQSLDLSSNVAITSRVTKEEILTDTEIQEVLKGEKGDKGEDALPMTTHYAWADSPDGKTGFSRTDSSKKYRGQVVAPPLNYLMGEVEGYGRNLLRMTKDFNARGWKADSARVTRLIEDGDEIIHWIVPEDNSGSHTAVVVSGEDFYVPMENSESYVYSMWAYTPNKAANIFRDVPLHYHMYASDVSGNSAGLDKRTTLEYISPLYTSHWTRLSTKLDTKDSSVGDITFRPMCFFGTSIINSMAKEDWPWELKIKHMKVEKGSTPTPWMIAPEDLDLPETYVWSQVRGEDGAEGPQGPKGDPGQDVDPEKLQLIEDTINEIKSTGHITPAEKQHLLIKLAEIAEEKQVYEANDVATESEKWSDYDSASSALMIYLNGIVADMSATTTIDPTDLKTKLDSYHASLELLRKSIEQHQREALLNLTKRMSDAELVITADAILQVISSSELYETKIESDASRAELEENFAQLLERTSSLETNINGFTSEVTSRLTENAEIVEEITSYLKFENGVLKLGNTLEMMYLQQQNDRLSFMNGDLEEAYFSNKTLYVDEVVTTRIALDRYELIGDANVMEGWYNG